MNIYFEARIYTRKADGKDPSVAQLRYRKLERLYDESSNNNNSSIIANNVP